MKEVFYEAFNELNMGKDLVIASVVRTKGSTPQKPGAKLLVRNDGTGVGTLGGGCVEGDIWFAAKQLLDRRGDTQYRDYELNEDIAAKDGLVCGGTMYFLIDPIYNPDDFVGLAAEINTAYEGGPSLAVASLVKPAAGSDVSIGTKIVVREDGSVEGSIGSPLVNIEAASKAKILMEAGTNEYVISKDGTEYFIEAYTTPPQLILCGAGHVSQAIAPLAKSLGFKVFVIDDRKEFANAERFPESDILEISNTEDGIANLPINLNSYIVIATRGHRYDNVALAAASRTPARYVGLLGSRRKTILIFEDLVRMGVTADRIREIRSPIGLNIHARTPNELAISIMAEILMFRLGGTGEPMRLDDDLINKILDKSSST